MTTDAWGITDGFHDISGVWHSTSAETRAIIRASMGDPGVESPPAPSARVIHEGTGPEIDGAA